MTVLRYGIDYIDYIYKEGIMKTFNLKMDAELHRKFKIKIAESDTTMNRKINELIAKFANEGVEMIIEGKDDKNEY